MTTSPTPDQLDDLTVDLIFALRDSLTELSRLDFWGGRCTTALAAAAAGSDSMPQAITTAMRKLQIDVLTAESAKVATRVAAALDGHYEAWVSHVDRTAEYIVALANVSRDARKPTAKPTTQEAIPY